jgi:hypothetical protein
MKQLVTKVLLHQIRKLVYLCIPLRIKDDNIPPKFIVPIENATLKNHNSYKNGLEILNSSNYGTYGNKGNSNYGIDLNR